MRRCKKCGDDKPLTAFFKNRECRGGHEGTCKACRRPMRACGWCHRVTVDTRPAKGGGYECRRESRCIARRSPNYGVLVRLGVSRALERLESHRYNLSATAREFGVATAPLINFLRRNAPRKLASLRRSGKIRRGYNHAIAGSRSKAWNDPAVLTGVVLQHNGRISLAAAAMGCSEKTVRQALRKLAPELYAQLKWERKIGPGSPRIFDDPVAFSRTVRRYDGRIHAIAAAAGCSRDAVRRSLRRLVPELYAQLIQQRRERSVLRVRRRNRPKQDPALHPWRLAERASFARAQTQKRSAA